MPTDQTIRYCTTRVVRFCRLIAVFTIAVLLGNVVTAEEYDPNRDPGLLRCDDIYNRGDIDGAISCFTPLTRAASLHVAAEAYWALGDSRAANEQFRRAVAEQPGNPHIRARWGRLFLSTHQPSQAVPLFEEALQLDPDYLHAKTGLVAALLTQSGGEGRSLLMNLAADHPDDVELLLLQSRLLLESKSVDEADVLLDRALITAQKENISPLDIYALKTSADLLRDIDDSPWIQKALDYSPSYGDIYFIPVHYHLINYRYEESVELLKKAVEVQPTHWSAHSQLGINMLRLNDIEGAKKHLEIAYTGDPYDTATVNTLRLLETLKDFRDIDTVATYTFNGDGSVPVVMRLHKDEAEYLSPYVEELTRRAVDTFTSRYEFELEEPLIVELFPNHDDFAVRTVSTPGVGLLGVAFGYLLAMDSPSGRPPGDFHWGSVLWHELAHVFTIKKSRHRMPRWFTEGVSVYEEWNTGPLPGWHIPIDVLEAIRDKKLLPVAELDNGFVRPTYPNQVTVSYMQAGLVCQLISERWGHDKLPEMLTLFNQRKDTSDTIEAVLGVTPEQLDRELEVFIDREFGTVISQLDEWREIVTSVNRAYQSQQWATVIALADQANEIFPQYVDKGNTWIPLHDAYVAMGKNDEAIAALQTWYEYGGYQPDMLHQLAHRLRDEGQTDKAIEVLESINWVLPNNIDLHEKLGQDYYATGNYPGALREFKSLLGLDPHDKSVVYLNIARTYQQLGDTRMAKRNVLQALEQAPFFRQAQDLLVELTGDSS